MSKCSKALARHYPHAKPDFRWAATIILENIHSDRSASTLWHWLRCEQDPKAEFRLLRACLKTFLPAAIEPARQALPTRGLKKPDSRPVRGITVIEPTNPAGGSSVVGGAAV